MNTNDSMSQVVEINKIIIKLYFEAYNTKNEAIFDEIIGRDYIDHEPTLPIWARLENELRERRMTLSVH
jgi:hypothetical protein